MDVLDFIEPNLSRPRTRKQILSKLKEFGLDPLGAKANKGSVLDRNFPIIQMKQLIEEFNAKEDKENEDMVDFIKTRLAETHGEFSRPKIIKQINYLGIDYERKRKPTSKKYKEWTEGLRTELAALKLQYEEMDAEDHELIDLVDYVMRRLSEKKLRRQVERELEALGAVIKRREKPRASRKKQGKDELNEIDEDEQNPGSYRSESSDAELELEELSDDDHDEASEPSNGVEKENITPNAKADTTHSVIEDISRNVTPVKASPLDVEDSQDSTKKRKRVLASSDEEDDAVPVEERKERTLSDSPIAVKQKKHRVVLSDSDED
ncbi:hypothetical protein OESDEN_22965 [Oesophagostomum dentatum]|uniref:Uncharacterized protein n=1 Tax=Oesophagostomum dentatum TaxID=61180 RepID=A0A0B1S2E6_OESDE|nr:hypothetical protein OESDEN_22965 [Oesophagostomum dentatum]